MKVQSVLLDFLRNFRIRTFILAVWHSNLMDIILKLKNAAYPCHLNDRRDFCNGNGTKELMIYANLGT